MNPSPREFRQRQSDGNCRDDRWERLAFFKVVAVDFDGTLTSGGNLASEAVEAIDQARRNGLAIVLATGRIGAELHAEFPQIADHVDALVLENGAVIVVDGQSPRASTAGGSRPR